jgi:hypothetical protein
MSDVELELKETLFLKIIYRRDSRTTDFGVRFFMF